MITFWCSNIEKLNGGDIDETALVARHRSRGSNIRGKHS